MPANSTIKLKRPPSAGSSHLSSSTLHTLCAD